MNGRALLVLALTAGSAAGMAGVGTPPAVAAAAGDRHRLDWGDCQDDVHEVHDVHDDDDDLADVRCAELEVPLDHADADGATLTLSILRVPATGPAKDRVGALFVNPGGPGATARGFAAELARRLPGAVRRRFDVIGVDPRGTGASALDCGYDITKLLGADPLVENEGEAAALVEVDRDYVASCQAEAGELLPHLGTRAAARDIDAVRAALGDEQVSFLGFGYGAALGQTYAQLFPERVRALVLDGGAPLGASGPQLAHDQALGLERTLVEFALSCNDQPDCPAQPDALGAVTELMARTQQDPVPAEPRDLGMGELETGLTPPLRDQSRWDDLATAVEAALLGNGTRLVGMADQYIDHVDVDLSYAVNCLDLAWPTGPGGPGELLAAAAATEADAPRFGDAVTNHYLPCTMWPVAADPLTPPARPLPPTAAPALVVATTGDPATPVQAGVDLAQQLGGVLLTHDGAGHTIVGQGLDCIDDAVAAYLVDLELPDPGSTCLDLP